MTHAKGGSSTPGAVQSRLGFVGEQVRRQDFDRYLTGLFAPADRRGDLFALYAFNGEVARVRETVSEPMLGQIRLQWWREALDEIYGGGAVREHPVAGALAEAVRGRALPRAPFERLIDAREADLTDASPATMEALLDYIDATAGDLSELALHVVAPADAEGPTRAAARHVGRAWGLTGLVRAVPFHAAQKRSFLPASVMSEAGARERDLFDLRSTAALSQACRRLADEARRSLVAARVAQPRPSKAALPVLLPAVLARRFLDRLAKRKHDPFAEPPVEIAAPRKQLGLMTAAWRRRI